MSPASSAETAVPTSAMDFFEQLSSQVGPETILRKDEPLARRTTLRVGGPCDIFAEPANEPDLAALIRLSSQTGFPFFILGRGSNVLVRDGGFRGLVISLGQPFFSRISINGVEMQCGAGAKLKQVSIEARRHGITGFEFLEGIPGSVGGALRMNAGAMNSSMFELVQSVRVMNYSGEIREMPALEMNASYRCCEVLRSSIALGATMKGHAAPVEEIEKRMADYSQKRWSSQPAALSAGCMFKNPVTIPAGKLIDELGLKGSRVGGAVVSQEHGNFIVNDGTARARDVLALIETVRQKALSQRGIELHTEVEVLGED
jgi:UDP-N-acetylenolpyruvoylglucosamine reductase